MKVEEVLVVAGLEASQTAHAVVGELASIEDVLDIVRGRD